MRKTISSTGEVEIQKGVRVTVFYLLFPLANKAASWRRVMRYPLLRKWSGGITCKVCCLCILVGGLSYTLSSCVRQWVLRKSWWWAGSLSFTQVYKKLTFSLETSCVNLRLSEQLFRWSMKSSKLSMSCCHMMKMSSVYHRHTKGCFGHAWHCSSNFWQTDGTMQHFLYDNHAHINNMHYISR